MEKDVFLVVCEICLGTTYVVAVGQGQIASMKLVNTYKNVFVCVNLNANTILITTIKQSQSNDRNLPT